MWGLAAFETGDFVRLHSEIVKRGVKVVFFDEIQFINGWELYVNQLLREKYTVFVTGSNAAMLSAEIGTHLTGRHLSVELWDCMSLTGQQQAHATIAYC